LAPKLSADSGFRTQVEDALGLALRALDGPRLDDTNPSRHTSIRFDQMLGLPLELGQLHGRQVAGGVGPRPDHHIELVEPVGPAQLGARRFSCASTASICDGNTFTPRMINMSSLGPRIRSIRRMRRAVPGSKRVRSRVR